MFIDLHEHEHCSDPADHLARVRQHLGNAIADQALSRCPDASYGLLMPNFVVYNTVSDLRVWPPLVEH